MNITGLHFKENEKTIVREVQVSDINQFYLNTLCSISYTKFLNASKNSTHSIESLQSYVEHQLYSKESFLWGLFLDGVMIATSRIFMQKSKLWQGILVFKEFSGKGFGTKLVNYSSDLMLAYFSTNVIYAGIDARNISSQIVFRRSGYKLCSYSEDSGIQTWYKSIQSNFK